MYKDRRVAVVIPAYNAARHIARVVSGIPSFIDHIIVVEDGGTDDTGKILQELIEPRLTVVHHAVNQGVGGAMVSGFRAAMEHLADIVVKMDADGQMDPAFLPHLLDPLVSEDYAYTKGNRFLCEEHLRTMPRIRLAGNFVLTFLSKLASGYWHVFDPANGYIAIDMAMVGKLPLQRLARGYFFETDMLIQLNVFRARVKEVPVPSRYGDERSSMHLGRVMVTFPLYLLKGFWFRIYERHVLREFSPVAVFWMLGSLLLSWGTGFGAYTWLKSYLTGQVSTTGTVMLSVLPFILGFQLVLQAILIEIQESPR